MALTPGMRVGPHEILSLLGSGGMGDVYRARDTTLNREVALKALPDAFTNDADRLARFKREAHVLASLNHPNIAAIYGFEESSGVQALVLELVDGPTLADRIAQGPIPLGHALSIARQIADGLDAAHEQGIIHRDLKPANIKLRPDGTVKVLDFGLAKMLDVVGSGESSRLDVTVSPTITRAGLILGTVAYMSPEQAGGVQVDARTDIWAFGCVLYEMLTGQRAFPGETISDAIAAILEREPRWDRLPEGTPESVRRLLRRCLTKDPRQRLRHIADARIEIDEALVARTSPAPATEPATRPRPSLRMITAAVVIAAVASAVAIAWVWTWSAARPAGAVVRTLVEPLEPFPTNAESLIAISPDGQHLAYVSGRDAEQRLYLRSLDQFESKAISGTEGADFPVFSPDGQWLAFVADHKVKKVAVKGGAPVILCDVSAPNGLSWEVADAIYFNRGTADGIRRVSAAGGTPVEVTKLEAGDINHTDPAVLSDGSAVLFRNANQIYAQSLKTGERHALGLMGAHPHVLQTGLVLYTSRGTLYAVPFDTGRLQVTGQPVAVLEGIHETVRGRSQVSFSRAGTMVYISSNGQPRQDVLMWVDHNGTETPVGPGGNVVRSPRLSPDGRRIAAISGRVGDSSNSVDSGDVLLYDLTRETWNRFTDQEQNSLAVWTPDGNHLTMYSRRDNGLYSRPLDGGARDDLYKSGGPTIVPLSWSPDGERLAVVTISPSTSQDVAVVERQAPGALHPLVNSKFREGGPTFSPDGRWIAYVSDKSGHAEIYMRPVQGAGEEWAISTGGGNEPVWARNAPFLFYRHDDTMMVVDVVTAPTVAAGKPRRLFEKRYQRSPAFWPNYDVTADGKRLLMIKRAEQSAPTHINVVLNWTEELKQRVPTQ
jgi:eukaryotic-like serine/threonine-protein kinase